MLETPRNQFAADTEDPEKKLYLTVMDRRDRIKVFGLKPEKIFVFILNILSIPVNSVFQISSVPFVAPWLIRYCLAVRRMALRKPKFIGANTCTERWSLKIRRYMEEKE
jgi:hypothetical protein